MPNDKHDKVRAAVAGADRAFEVITGGKRRGRGDGPPPTGDDAAEEPPIMALGHLDGSFVILDIEGQARTLTARQLGSRHDLTGLFLGNDAWLRRMFPKRASVKRRDAHGNEVTEEMTVDFRINAAVTWLQAACGKAGLYGDHIQLRRPGVWPEADELPAVHCGDQVLIGDTWKPAGYRRGNEVWAAAPPTARPTTPCGAAIGTELRARLRTMFNFRLAGAEAVIIGLIGTAYYGAAAPWRASGFLIGGAGCGKSTLLTVMRACAPLHHYTNDTSKAGLEQQIDGRAMPAFIDEAGDQEDQRGARRLLDLVVSAAGGEGTKGHRGGVDGKARKVEVVGSIVMASITPPDMQPQHIGRFTLVELDRPNEDHSGDHAQLVGWARAHAPALWGRAIAGWSRYCKALILFRHALSRQGCQPREMDQLGALLAGHWVLTEEGEPSERDGNAGVSLLQSFVRDQSEIRSDDAPRRMINHLFSTLVQLDRSTDREPVGALLRHALGDIEQVERFKAFHVDRLLSNYGLRVIRAADTQPDIRGRSAPRAAEGSGVWFHPRHSPLSALFQHTPWQGDRWQFELRRFESARSPKLRVRIGTMQATTGCIWVSAAELGFDTEEDEPA